jgi:membrane protein
VEVCLISNHVRQLYQRVDHVSGNRLDIVKDAFRTFVITRASQASASIAYYVIFSLFPLLLVLISAGSFFLDSEQVYLKATQLIQQTIPATSYDWITQNLQYVLQQRGSVGVIGLVTLLWAASGGFICLAYNINLAWLEAPQRNFFQGRLIGLQMIAALSGLFFMTLVLDTIISLVHLINLPIISILPLDILKRFYGIFSWGVIFSLFFLLYDLVPTVNVPGRAAVWGALTASIAWKIATALFAWYVTSRFGRYELVYGSVGTLVAFMFLIYILATVTLFGAHLTSAIDRRIKLHRTVGLATSPEDIKG